MNPNYPAGYERRRLELVTVAGRFLISGLPLEVARTRQALRTFLCNLAGIHVHRADLEAVLIACLERIQRAGPIALPSLVDRFLAGATSLPDPVERFHRSVESWIAAATFESREMQRIAAHVHCHLATPLSAESIGQTLDISFALVRSTVHEALGVKLSQFIRNARLDRAAEELRTGACRVKEVQALVGYNDASNFAHGFHERFGCRRATIACGPLSPSARRNPFASWARL